MRERLAKKLLRVTLECTKARLADQGEIYSDGIDEIFDWHWNHESGLFQEEAFALADCAIKELSN